MTNTPPTVTWRVVVEFAGIDLDDDDIVDALVADPTVHIGLSSSEFVTTANAVIPAEDFTEAFNLLLATVEHAVPDAELLRFVDPLVTVADIADDAGVTRQAVRNWSLGLRQSGFPRPLAIVGDGVRVWRQADVDEWLTAAMNLGSDHRYPPASFIARFNEQLAEEVENADGWHIVSEITERQATRAHRRTQPVAAHENETARSR